MPIHRLPDSALHASSLLVGVVYFFTSPASATDGVISSGAITGDVDSGVNAAKTYTALGNIVGGDVTVNGVTFLGTGTSGTGWALTGAGVALGGGGNHTTTFGGSAIAGLFDGFQYNGNPGTLTLSGLTVGQTYVATLYNEAWGLGADRTQTITAGDGSTLVYNEDALEASVVRYTFVATAGTTTLNFLPKIPGSTMHFYGMSTEQVFNNTWNPNSGNSWNTAANWSKSTIPTTVGSNASFAAQGGATAVSLDSDTTTGHIQFLGTGSYSVTGSNTLTIQTDAGGTSVLNAEAGGSHTIATPITLGSDTVKFGAGTITLGGAVSGSKSLTVSSGTLRFGSTNSYSGGTGVGSGATLDLNGTSQSLGALNGAGAIVNDNGGTSLISVSGGNFSGTIKNHNTGAGIVSLTKNTNGALTLSGVNTYTGATTIDAGTLKLSAPALLTDNFSATGNPNTANLNYNLANRQTGSAALQNWNPAGNTQVGNPTAVTQPIGTNGDYLLLAFGASASLNTLPLTTANVSGPLKLSFDMFKGNAGNTSEWTSFTLRNAPNQGFPVAGSGEFGMLYRKNTGIQVFNNGGAIQDLASTTAGDSFTVYLADAAGIGSPFAGNGTRVILMQGATTMGSYLLNTGMGTTYLTFGSAGGMIGGVDNLSINPFATNLLASTANLTLTTTGASLNLDGVQQTIASLTGVSNTSVNLGPFTKLTVDGSTSTTFDGTITGTGSLVKAGSSTLILGGADTYTGGTTISSGVILAHNATSLGTGAVSIASGANYLPWWNTANAAISNNFTLNGPGGFSPGGDKAAIYADGGGAGGLSEYTLTGSITLAATSNLGGNNSNNLRVSGQITGPGGLTKGGGRTDENNTLIIGNTANDYAGETLVTKGTVKLAASEVIPHGAGKGGLTLNTNTTLDLGGFSETVNRLSGNGNIISTASVGTPVYFNDDAGSGISSSKTYTHALDFAEGLPVAINGVSFSGAGLSGTGTGTPYTYTLTGAGPSAGNGATGATGDVSRLLTNFYYNGNPATLTLSGLIPGQTYEAHLYERFWGGNRTQLFTVNAGGGGTGTTIYNEDTTSTPSYIPFRYTADSSGQVTITTNQLGDGTYHWYGASNEVVAGPTLTFGDSSNQSYSGNISGPTTLTKQGSGTQTFSGTNTHTGATNLNGGTLLLASATALSSASNLTLSGATLAAGGFTNAGAVLSQTTGENIIDFAGGNGQLTFANTATWTGILSIWNYDGALWTSGNDKLIFTANGLNSMDLSNIHFYTGAGTGLIDSSGAGFLPSGELVPVPEPTAIISALGLVMLGWRRESRRRH